MKHENAVSPAKAGVQPVVFFNRMFETWMPAFAGMTVFGILTLGPIKSLHATQINTFGKLEIMSDDRTFSLRITGRVHVDANFYDSDSEDKKLTSGAYVRRARIGVLGNFREWEYEVEIDNAAQRADLTYANLKRAIGTGKLAVGQFKIYESLEHIASSNDIAFMERPYVSDATPGFQIGAGYNGEFRKFGYSGAVYNLREASDGESRPINGGLGLVGRAYVAPIHEKTIAVHIGASYAFEKTDSTGARVRVSPIGRAQDFNNLENFRFELFDRRAERAEIDRAIIEGAAINGPLCVQGEYLDGSAQTKTRPDDDFSAWYAQASYVLTGEWREYDFRRGRIKRPEPSRAIGAVEIAARYQQAERKNEPGAKLTATEFSVIYYANLNVRFMLGYGWADNNLINDKPNLLSTRVQFDF